MGRCITGNVQDVQQRVVDLCHTLVGKGYLVGTGGNLSIRLPGQDALAVTPSNYDYLQMKAEDIPILDWDLRVIEGEMKPSIESAMHAAVYKHRADVVVVIHTHQTYASALALANLPIPALFDEQVRYLGRSVEVVPYAPSGTGFLKKNIISALRNHGNAYLLQNHGALCLGPDGERAIFNVELLEKCALTYLLALCTDKKVACIPAVVREIAFAKLRQDQKKFAKLKEG